LLGVSALPIMSKPSDRHPAYEIGLRPEEEIDIHRGTLLHLGEYKIRTKN
jgi:hypothetical protein